MQVGLYPDPVAQGGATQLAGADSQYYFGLSQEIVTRHKLKRNRAAAGVADQQARRFEERIIPKAREWVTIFQEAFALGQFDSLRLLQSQRGLVESNLGYIAPLEARRIAAAELAGLAQLESFP
jgi:hypothetical protein